MSLLAADQLLAHAVGDYVLQSDWMATQKTRRSFVAVVHALTYGLPFLFLEPSLAAFLVIVGTHFVIDRWRLARYLCWFKNNFAPWGFTNPREGDEARSFRCLHNRPFAECAATGYSPDLPIWLTAWLLIIVDNIMHVVINALALKYL